MKTGMNKFCWMMIVVRAAPHKCSSILEPIIQQYPEEVVEYENFLLKECIKSIIDAFSKIDWEKLEFKNKILEMEKIKDALKESKVKADKVAGGILDWVLVNHKNRRRK